MRIVGGALRGRVLAKIGIGDGLAHLRPTTDRVRESIFNLLIHAHYNINIETTRVLDLCAGSGAMGLEAISRGSLHACFVDNNSKSQKLLAQNIALLGVRDKTKCFRVAAENLEKNQDEPYNLIFLDPPYGKDMGRGILMHVLENKWLAQRAIIVWEEGVQQDPPECFEILECRKYGTTWVHFLQYQG